MNNLFEWCGVIINSDDISIVKPLSPCEANDNTYSIQITFRDGNRKMENFTFDTQDKMHYAYKVLREELGLSGGNKSS